MKGCDNPVANALSRFPINAIHTVDSIPVVDFCAMAAAQAEDEDILNMRAEVERVPLALSDGVFLLCDVSTGVQRPIVPESFHMPILTPCTNSHIQESEQHSD